MNKNIGIIGLGLIGGSFAKAIKKNTNHSVFGFDLDSQVIKTALQENSIDDEINVNSLDKCDIIIIALYPKATQKFICDNINNFKKGSLIVDCTGVKQNICAKMSTLCLENGYYFIGGHPMAGKENSGYEFCLAELFDGASMILCNEESTNTVAIKQAEMLFISIGFGKVTVTTAKEHDRIIAFTSQLAHVVSSAYIKSETAKSHVGFSAGSYNDLTRIAKLNPQMWAELFFENKENLLFEIDTIIKNLTQYKFALENDDTKKMEQLLLDGKLAKAASEKQERFDENNCC